MRWFGSSLLGLSCRFSFRCCSSAVEANFLKESYACSSSNFSWSMPPEAISLLQRSCKESRHRLTAGVLVEGGWRLRLLPSVGPEVYRLSFGFRQQAGNSEVKTTQVRDHMYRVQDTNGLRLLSMPQESPVPVPHPAIAAQWLKGTLRSCTDRR